MTTSSFCTQCGSGLAAGARFCGSCGNSAIYNGPSQPSISTPSPVRTLPNPGDLVYLFGDLFVPKDSWRSQGVILESSGVKVQKKPLAQTMLLAAIAALVKAQTIDLQVVKTGVLMFKQDVPVIRRVSSEPCRLGGLEGAIVERLDGRGDLMNSVAQVVGRLVGSDQFDPWDNVFSYAKAHLMETGHFLQTENPSSQGLGRLVNSRYRLEPQGTLIMECAGRTSEVKALLDSLRSSRGRAWELAAKQIEQTLKGAQSKDDGEDSGSSSSVDSD